MFKNRIKSLAKFLATAIDDNGSKNHENYMTAMGSLLSNQQALINSSHLNDFEFKIFSQFGDDGIIQYLIKNVNIGNKIFIEFGVEDFLESNTRFLMVNNNWSGLVMDGSETSINRLKAQTWFWKYDLQCKAVFIEKNNINEILAHFGFANIGILHIDLDGNDYHILEEIELSVLNPSILIMEYNSVFGDERKITVPYRKDFSRSKAHYSNLYWGASLPAIAHLANTKGYKLVGCNLAGNNAYFIRENLLNEKVREVSLKSAYNKSLYRESRNEDGSLSYLREDDRLNIISGLNILNIVSNQIEKL
ncbi:hypothetical protein [Pedobacter miscanthi]|uniref:hypothetical protein n=1 Tax=Pedobacter miscanthi TaxID=2259170 RepID=UPI002931E914|nr:hypothetical protein [Pedobacter miscanthi]